MAVGLLPPHDLLPVAGLRLAVAEGGVRYAGRRDLTLITLAEGSEVAGVFTRNRFSAAPVIVAQRHLSAGTPHFVHKATQASGPMNLTDSSQFFKTAAATYTP